jgi:hypothetical protein
VTVWAFLCAAFGHVAFSVTFSAEDALNWSEDAADVTPDERFVSEGAAQVYEYDPQAGTLTRVSIGEDGCSGGRGRSHEVGEVFCAQSFCEYREGRVHLLAGVAAESGLEHARLLGGGASGAGVFFSTREARVLEAGDSRADYYDARIWREGADAEKARAAERPMAENAASGRGAK